MGGFSIIGIVIAIGVVYVLDLVSGLGAIVLFMDTPTEESVRALTQQTAPLRFIILASTLSGAVGGYVAARIGKAAPYLNAFVVGLGGIWGAASLAESYPAWFVQTAYAIPIPAALLGAFLVARKSG